MENDDLFLEQLFSAPLSEQEIALTSGATEEKPKVASEEEVQSLFQDLDNFESKEVEKTNNISYTDAIKSGGIRSVAGIAQAVLSVAEAADLVDKGATKDFTNKVLSMEKSGDMSLGQALIRDTLASSIPIVAEIMATRNLTLIPALKRTAAIGGAGGMTTFVENPDQAFATSSTRMINGIMGTTIGPLFLMGGAALGRGAATVRGRRGEIEAVGPDIAPSPEVRQEGARLIEEAQKQGVVLTPGAATGDPALAAAERRAATVTTSVDRQLADVIGSNATNMDGIIDDLLNTIYPPADGGALVGRMFETAATDVIPKEPFYALLKGSRIMKDLMSEVANDPTKAAAYGGYQPNSIGRINYLRKELQNRIDNLSPEDARPLIMLKSRLDDIGRKNSSTFDEALKLSQRQKTAQEVSEALIRDGYNETVPFRNSAESFVSGIKNKKIREKLMFGLESISDPKDRAQAMEKFALIERLLPAVVKMEKTLTSALASGDDVLARRADPTVAGSWTIYELLNRNNNEKFLKFILDPNKSAARLRELLPKRNTNTEEFARGIALWASELLDGPAILGVSPERVVSPEQENYLKTSSVENRARAFDSLSRAGKAEELQAKNPTLYDKLFKAYGQVKVA